MQKNAVTTAAPASTPDGTGQPARRPATGAATAVTAAVASTPTRRKEMSQGASLRGGAGRATAHRSTWPASAAPGLRVRRRRTGATTAAGPRGAGGRVLGAAALALGGHLRRPRLPRRAAGPRAEDDDDADHQQHGDGDEQLGPAPGDRQRHGAEGQQGGPEVHDQHGPAVRVADGEQPVVQVHLVRRERRPAPAGAPDDGHHQVDERDEQDRDRHQQRQGQRQQARRGVERLRVRLPGGRHRGRRRASGRPASTRSRP